MCTYKRKFLISAITCLLGIAGSTDVFAGSVVVNNPSALTTSGGGNSAVAAITSGTIAGTAITSSTIDGAVIGGSTPANGTFTNLSATGLILPGNNNSAPGLAFSKASTGFFFNVAGFGLNSSFDTTAVIYVNTDFLVVDTNSYLDFTVSSATGLAYTKNSPPVGDISTTLATTAFLTYGSQAAAIVITAGASPFAYTCPVKGNLLVTGGVQSAITLTRAATAYSYGGMLNGAIHCSKNDIVTITYSTAPILNLIPE